jgi:type I restriction enzyme M protein
MLGAICGDIVGSVYEGNNIKSKNFSLFSSKCSFTDDSVMTGAISLACKEYMKNKDITTFENNCIKFMQLLGRRHINAGYGGNFIRFRLQLRIIIQMELLGQKQLLVQFGC